MRAVTYSDLAAVAGALYLVDASARPTLCHELFHQADIADRYTRRLGKTHPKWGRGTLLEAACQHPLIVDPGFVDPEYCACFSLALKQLQNKYSLSLCKS